MVAATLVLPSFAIGRTDCPDPRTCRSYKFFSPAPPTVERWAASKDGMVRIPYWINPLQPYISVERAVAAIQTALRTWEAANPRIMFSYQGQTSVPPIPNDGMNVIGWAPGPNIAFPRGDNAGRLVEFDIALAYGLWDWHSCGGRDGSCTMVPWYEPGGLGYFPNGFTDVQNLVTHEAGHALGLADLQLPRDCLMTMNGGAQANATEQSPPECDKQLTNRSASTLALGDVLGLKFLYPWTCPHVARGARMPAAYREICPVIKIYRP